MRIKDGKVSPAMGISEILLNMTRKELIGIIGSDFSERKIETGAILEIENAGFWLDKNNLIDQIGVWSDFKGKLHDVIGIGSTLSDVEKYIGKWKSVFPTYEIEELPGICFELGDLDELDDWDELIAPIERIYVFRI